MYEYVKIICILACHYINIAAERILKIIIWFYLSLYTTYTEAYFLKTDNKILWQMEAFFLITGPLWGESTGHRWIPLKKGQ